MTNLAKITDVSLPESAGATGLKSCPESASLRLSRFALQTCIDKQLQEHLPVISIGSEVACILPVAQAGLVVAVFRRCFYVQCAQGVFCVGLPSLGRGPLHVLLDSDRDSLPGFVVRGQSVDLYHRTPSFAVIDAAHRSHLPAEDSATLYDGMVPCTALAPSALRQFEKVLEHMVPPQHGFGWILGRNCWHSDSGLSDPSNERLGLIDQSLRSHCFPALQCLYCWLKELLGRPVEEFPHRPGHGNSSIDELSRSTKSDQLTPIPTLLGAGPGLTPAGDDLLAGVMLALYRINRGYLAHTLWELLEPFLVSRTNAISGAHLHQAAKGRCSENVLQLLECILDENTCKQSNGPREIAIEVQAQANRIGASSGWDTLAGMSVVLHALLMLPQEICTNQPWNPDAPDQTPL